MPNRCSSRGSRRIRFPREAVLVLWGVLSAGCAGRQVTRISADAATDLSGRWNDTDSREVSDRLIPEALSATWITDWQASGGGKPVVVVGVVRNRTAEHIPVGTFVGDIERAFVNSGKVSVVATAAEREDLREERADQWRNATEESAKQMGRELGADFLLTGAIESVSDREGGQRAVFFQVDLSLIQLETNEKVWIGQHKIKKLVQQGRVSP